MNKTQTQKSKRKREMDENKENDPRSANSTSHVHSFHNAPLKPSNPALARTYDVTPLESDVSSVATGCAGVATRLKLKKRMQQFQATSQH